MISALPGHSDSSLRVVSVLVAGLLGLAAGTARADQPDPPSPGGAPPEATDDEAPTTTAGEATEPTPGSGDEPAPTVEADETAAPNEQPAPGAESAAEDRASGPDAAGDTAAQTTPADGPATADEATAPPPLPLTGRAIAIWSLTGVAGVGVIAGGVFGLSALAEEQRFEENGSRQAKDRGEARALVADVSFGVAAGAAVAALIIWLATDDTEQDVPNDDDSSPTVEVGTNGTGAILNLRF